MSDLTPQEQAEADKVRAYIGNLQAQNRHLALLLTAIIKRHGKEQVIYAAGKAPGIELMVTKEDLELANGAWHLEQHPQEGGGVVLKLVRTPPQAGQH